MKYIFISLIVFIHLLVFLPVLFLQAFISLWHWSDKPLTAAVDIMFRFIDAFISWQSNQNKTYGES